MAKKIINDIIIPTKSIRRIPILANKKHFENEVSEEKDSSGNEYAHSSRPAKSANWQRRPLNPKFVIWLIAGICLLSLFFGISILFSSATIIVTPKTEKIIFANDSYTATLDAKDANVISYEVLGVPKQEAGETINVTEEKEVSKKSSGTIIIYNNYSTAPQRLINNTRFESSGGKIYRINSSVIVPGIQKNGSKVIPGSIEATVFADQPGDSYNLKLSDLTGDFKIPGFKGDPRYDSFYGRLKTDITGGFVGTQKIVGEELRKQTEESLKLKLKEQLIKQLYAIKPENYITFKDGYTIDYTNLADINIDSNKVEINMQGELNGIVFNNSKLANYLAIKKIDGFNGLPTEFLPSDNLVVTLTGKDNTGYWKNSTLEVKLSGDATIKWIYDGDSIKKDLAGKNEADLKNFMAKYSDSMTGIKILFMPVWTRYVPDDLNKIKIKEEVPA